MRWLIIGLLVSLGALLLTTAGVARHIRLHRAKLRAGRSMLDLNRGTGSAQESDLEPEP